MEIETIKQLARERGIDLAVHGLVCLPREIKKYTGCIQMRQKKGGGVTYRARIVHKDLYLSKTFNTEAEAEQYIRETNVREGLPIRNSFTIFADRVLVDLTGDKLLICDHDNLYLVESHTWCSSNGYAVTGTNSTTLQYFHNMVMRHIPSDITVNHINRNCLDNHKINLRLVNQRIQSINRGCQVNNKSGVTGVCFDKKSNRWMATWQDSSGTKSCKWFSSKEYRNEGARTMAIEHCQKMIWSMPHYREALQLDAEA